MRRNPLARMRVSSGFSNAETAAKALGISRIHLLNVERGAAKGSKALLGRMVKLYGSNPEKVAEAVREAREDLLKRMLKEAREGF